MDSVGIVLEPAPCPRCGSPTVKPVYSARDYLYGIPGEFHVGECARCGLWFQNPRPTPACLGAAYPSSYTPHAAGDVSPPTPQKLPLFQRALRSLWARIARLNPVPRLMAGRARRTALTPELVPNGRILEIGCAAGHRLTELRKQGWQSIQGIEMIPAAAERARALGFDVRCARVEEALEAVPDGSLDAVVSSMVLEHLYDPLAALKQVARKLKPGGQFLFSTVVRDSLDARLYGKYWAGFDLPRHMVHFTRRDLLEALEQDFERISAVRQAAPIDFVRSASWRVGQGEGTMLDRIFILMGRGSIAQAFSLLLASVNQTTRISFYSYRRHVRHAA